MKPAFGIVVQHDDPDLSEVKWLVLGPADAGVSDAAAAMMLWNDGTRPIGTILTIDWNSAWIILEPPVES